MSFDQLSSMESGGAGGGRRGGNNSASGGGGYADDPEFSKLSQDLMNKLFHLQGNVSKLRTDVGLLGTRRDNPRLRERVHTLLDESTMHFKEVGEGIKKIQSWEEVTVCLENAIMTSSSKAILNATLTCGTPTANTKVLAAEAVARVQDCPDRLPITPTHRP